MDTIVFATHNDNKLRELRAILGDVPINIVSLKEIGYLDEIIEDGKDLNENAWIKANTIYEKIGGMVLAEDTGLEVFALNGEPGVHSARYAGDHRNNEENIDLLLERLRYFQDRKAQFRTIFALWYRNQPFTFEGIVRGSIAFHRTGHGGFGYDSVFIPDGYTETFASLDVAVKNSISHRARALHQFMSFLRSDTKT